MSSVRDASDDENGDSRDVLFSNVGNPMALLRCAKLRSTVIIEDGLVGALERNVPLPLILSASIHCDGAHADEPSCGGRERDELETEWETSANDETGAGEEFSELLLDDPRNDSAADDVCGDVDNEVTMEESPEDEDEVRVGADAVDDDDAGLVDDKMADAVAKSDVEAESVRPIERWPLRLESIDGRFGVEVEVGSAADVTLMCDGGIAASLT